jgi:hypothetical protein
MLLTKERNFSAERQAVHHAYSEKKMREKRENKTQQCEEKTKVLVPRFSEYEIRKKENQNIE